MKYSFLLPLLLIGFVPFAFGEVEHGKNYDKEIIDVTPFGSPVIKHTALPYERINPLGTWQDYLYTNFASYHEIKTATNKIHLDKSTCAFSFYNKNDVYLFGDSIITFNSIVDQYTWNAVTQINNAACEAYYDNANHALVAKKYAAGVGYIEYKYIFDNGKWKTQLEATNLTSLTNRVFAFDQTIDLNRDTIYFGKQQRNLDNFNGTTFDRTWLETNEGNLLDFLNNFSFDLDKGFNYLSSVKITDTGPNKSKITFHYMRNNQVLMPNETLIIDPTFQGTPSSEDSNVASDATPADCQGKTVSGVSGTVRASTDPGICRVPWQTFDISPIPTSAVVTNASYTYDVTTTDVTTTSCYLFDYAVEPTASQATYDAVFTAAGIATANTDCQSATDNKVFVMNATGLSKIQENISGAEGFYALGIFFAPIPATTTDESVVIRSGDSVLEITYTISSVSISEINTEIVGDAAKVTGIITVTERPKTNLTSMIFLVNGTTIETNNTIQNATQVPYDVNFGPFWYQMITDAIYNFTIQAFVQSNVTTSSNSSSVYDSRGYDPDYFTALDPTQGTVNYTFPGGDLIYVNRDTNGIVFNIECRYYTQAQAFLNTLEDGTWDNETNVLFYQGDTTNFYYLECFNDGELFITPISQNYSNALVPGLLIFDQLGGFFGAPSIILVILSILSLGTGRNYPIIMLIAASVTAILLALELLTLDPGLVVALIVMTGFGLFGIRKFY